MPCVALVCWEDNLAEHPYQLLPDHCFWRRSIADVPAADVDPVIRAKFSIKRSDRIATAGSCFAQHISRHLAQNGFNYFVTEPEHPILAHLADGYNYGVYTARYGNIYTSRQLLQTLKRAYGLFTPHDDCWPIENGRVLDPYRPQIQPNGFACLHELVEDRRQHFAAIRKAIEELDVFVFTLGLTETWISRADGAAYPVCPGVAGGVFDADKHAFVNLTVMNVIADLTETIDLIRAKNLNVRCILTVSPVPLIATMEDRSVLASTTYSKSVLRVAAEEVAARYDEVAYFPSYEVITGSYTRGSYFADGLRDVTEDGVSHVMRLFMKHYTDESEQVAAPATPVPDRRAVLAERAERELAEVVAVMCDEIKLDPAVRAAELAPLVSQVDAHAGAAPALSEQLKPGSAMDFLRGEAAAPIVAVAEAPQPMPEKPKGFFRWFRRR
jgi:hypothetical protein